MLVILKIVAGIAALGIVCLVLIAVVSGLRASAGSITNGNDRDGR